MGSRKAFENVTWTSAPVFDPDEVRIIGGLSLENEDERGPLDTEIDEKHVLYDENLLVELDEDFVNNIEQMGVLQPITVVKLDGVPTVNYGRKRIRAARRANKMRKKAGLPIWKVNGVIKSAASPIDMLLRMISENEFRIPDKFEAKIKKAQRLLDHCNDPELVAAAFRIKPATLEGWFIYDDQATPLTKAAMDEGRINQTVAGILARIKDPTEQNAKLQELLTAPVGQRTVRHAASKTRRSSGGSPFIGRKQLLKITGAVQEYTPSARAGDETVAWWAGAKAFAKVIATGEGDKRLLELIEKATGGDAS